MNENKFKSKYSRLAIFIIVVAVISSVYLLFNNKAKIARNQSIQHQEQLNEDQIFSTIYSANIWGGGSGAGSKPENAIAYILTLQGLIYDNSIRTIADLGCGDWQIMEKIKIPSDKVYNGYDLVKNVIEENRKKYQADNVNFIKIDTLNDFMNTKADLLIVKDVIQHWPNSQIEFFLEKILPNFKYAIIINDYTSGKNIDIKMGDFRALNLEEKPFDEITKKSNIKFLMDYPAHGIIKRVYLFENLSLKTQTLTN